MTTQPNNPSTSLFRDISLAVHGGAGVILRQNLSPEHEKACRSALAAALRTGHAVLANGGTSRDGVEAAVRVLEDAPVFNAGRGSVFTHDGKNEMDASLMDGRTRAAGAVAGVTIVKNPICLARTVMERSPYVLLSGPGAEQFAKEHGLEIVDAGYFWTERRWAAFQHELQQREAALEPQTPGVPRLSEDEPQRFGTVGAVARDKHGDLAAATSTGGMTNKRWGRIGDSPLIGAGTWADNATCAVSATGHGEFFIRHAVAHDIHARMAYKGQAVAEAAQDTITTLKTAGGDGGVIAVDARGNAVLVFNTPGMYRGAIAEDGTVYVGIYQE
jgi:beta-aspartyl-peptidase (threonine type)